MDAVVDTNILVSGLIRRDGPPAEILRAIALRQLRPVVCTGVVTEYRDVLGRPRLALPSEEAAHLIDSLISIAVWVQVPDYTGVPPLPDPADWPFVACALAVGCPVITGNLKHFPEGSGVRVMTARAWVGGVR